MPTRAWLRGLPGSRLVRVVVLLVVGTWGCYQCLGNLGGENVVGDEHVYVTAGWEYMHGDFTANREHPPTAKYLFGLAQLVAGPGPAGPRVLVGLMVLVGGVVLLVWLRAVVGWWTGQVAAGLWWLTDRGGPDLRIDRLALLEPVMTFFALGAVVASWRWTHTRRPVWAVVTGVLLALAVTSKVSVVVLVPVVLALPLLYGRVRQLGAGVLVGMASLVVAFAALYWPVGVVSAVRYMLAFQEAHNLGGHRVVVAGQIYQFAPWWANLWFMADGVGRLTFVALVVGVFAALVVRPDRLVACLAACVAVLVVFYTAVARIALPTYYYAWMPFVVALCAIGYARLTTIRPVALTTALAVFALGLAGIASVGLTRTIADGRLSGIALVPGVLDEHGVRRDERVLLTGTSSSEYAPYLDGRGTASLRDGPFGAVVVGTDPRFPAPAPVRAVLADQRARFSTYRVDTLEVWVPRGDLVYDHGALTVR